MQAAMTAKPAVASRVAQRQSVRVQATAQRPVQVPLMKQAAVVALAAFAVVALAVGPAQAEDIKPRICGGNPTAKICLKNSAKN